VLAGSVDDLDEALRSYHQIGAQRDEARVRARLRAFGVRRRFWNQTERPVTGWASLTDTEREVAALVAQGRTNPQVAEQMFISPHTVKFHLRQVFRKLGIGSRVELARSAAEHLGQG
jgi:DNA-binding CsgD family transcriptional regulator